MSEPIDFPAKMSPYSDLAIYQGNEFCPRCAGQRIFIQTFEFDGGRAGYCIGCGNERVIPFTRTSEAA